MDDTRCHRSRDSRGKVFGGILIVVGGRIDGLILCPLILLVLGAAIVFRAWREQEPPR